MEPTVLERSVQSARLIARLARTHHFALPASAAFTSIWVLAIQSARTALMPLGVPVLVALHLVRRVGLHRAAKAVRQGFLWRIASAC